MIAKFSKILPLFGAVLIFFIFNITASQMAYAQEKSEYEKKQEEKIRKYRKRIKTRKTDKPYRGNAPGYFKSRRIRNTPSVYAQPDPYAFRSKRYQRRRIYSNDALKLSSPTVERPPKRNRIRTQSASGRYVINRKAKPYKLRDRKKWEDTYTGDNYGRRSGIEPRNTQKVSSFVTPNPYTKRGRLGDKPYNGAITGGARYNTATKRGEQAWQGDIAGKRLRRNRSRGGNFNVYPKVSPYANRKMRSERQRISRDQESFGTDPKNTQRAAKRGRVNVRSASGRYTVNRKARPYKLKDIKKWEETYTGDAYGRRSGIEPRNTQKVSTLVSPDPYEGRGRMGDKAYQGRITGGFSTATKKGERAWQGDIAGRKIDYSKPRNTQRSGGRAGRIPSASGGLHNNRGRAISGRPPSDIAIKEQDFQGNIKGRRALKGGGSISNRMNRNNNGRAILSFAPGNDARRSTQYSGDIHAEEIKFRFGSSHLQYEGDIPKEDLSMGFSGEHLNYSGNLKARRPLKGGGSISSRMNRNNSGRAILSFTPGNEARKSTQYSGEIQAEELYFKFGSGHLQYEGDIPKEDLTMGFSGAHLNYSGDIKTRRPLKGGGSRARNDWNNNEQALPKKYGDNTRTPGIFSGNIKSERRSGGGGSMSRRGWNNEEQALPRKNSGSSVAGNFRGKRKETSKYVRNNAADDNALRVKEPGKAYFQAGNFKGNMKESRRKISGSRHSSTKFYNSKNEDNAVEEKKKFISFKLLWNKLFNKSEPSNEKEKKPRYDKNEKGLWYE